MLSDRLCEAWDVFGINLAPLLIRALLFHCRKALFNLFYLYRQFVKWDLHNKGKNQPAEHHTHTLSGQMVWAEPSWICYWSNWNHICVLLSYYARKGEEFKPCQYKNAELWKSYRRQRGRKMPEPLGSFLPSEQTMVDPGSDMGRHLTAVASSFSFPSGGSCREGLVSNRIPWAWEKPTRFWAVWETAIRESYIFSLNGRNKGSEVWPQFHYCPSLGASNRKQIQNKMQEMARSE